MLQRKMKENRDMVSAPLPFPSARRAAGKIFLTAALALVLTVSAFAAVSPALRETLGRALGSFAGQSQAITGVAVQDKGIEIRPVSALADRGFIKIYCEVQDKTGDRLSDDMDISVDIGGLPYTGGIGMAEVISYDEQTRTALVEVTATGYELAEASPAAIRFSSFQPRDQVEQPGISFPREMLQTAGLQTMRVEPSDTKLVLVPEQTPAELDPNYARLSSVGFGDDGKLHIQTAFLGEANHSGSFLSTFLRNPLDPEDIRSRSSLGRGFLYNGTRYYDNVFEIDQAELGDMQFDDLHGFYQLREAVEGDWLIDLTIEPVESVTYSTNTQVGGALVKEVRISPLSIAVVSKSRATILGYRPTYATRRDGAKLILTNNCIRGMHTMDEAHDMWTFDEPMNPADIVSLNFDGVTVPLQ